MMTRRTFSAVAGLLINADSDYDVAVFLMDLTDRWR
jgi:hypothetical protein